MNQPIRILGIAGSLRRKSYNRAALRAAQQLAPEDAVIDIFELDGIPVFSEDDERQPPVKIVELKKRIREADAILFVTPEYNYSIPGVLKRDRLGVAALRRQRLDGQAGGDHGRAVGTLGTARAQYHLRQVFVFLNVHAINQPEVMIANAAQNFDAEGNLTNESTKNLIRQLLTNLVTRTRGLEQLKAPRPSVHNANEAW